MDVWCQQRILGTRGFTIPFLSEGGQTKTRRHVHPQRASEERRKILTWGKKGKKMGGNIWEGRTHSKNGARPGKVIKKGS